MVCMLSILLYTSYAFTFYISLQLTRTTNNNPVHLLAPIWTPERSLWRWHGCSYAVACSFCRSGSRGLSRSSEPVSTPIGRAGRFPDAYLSPAPGVIQLSNCFQSYMYKMIPRFHTSAYCWVWVLPLSWAFMFPLLEVVGSYPLAIFFLGVVVLFWLTCRRRLLYSRY